MEAYQRDYDEEHMSTSGSQTDPWLNGDVELDSWQEHEEKNAEGGEAQFADDDLEYGTYQFAIIDRSPILDDQFTPGKKKVKLSFVVVNSDDPLDVGKKISQWLTVSSHPMGNLYPFFKAAAGGHLDPTYRPKLSDLMQKQVKATWAPKTYNIPGKGLFEKDVLQTVMPARQEFTIPEHK